mgnify:CR=1 FL=1
MAEELPGIRLNGATRPVFDRFKPPGWCSDPLFEELSYWAEEMALAPTRPLLKRLSFVLDWAILVWTFSLLYAVLLTLLPA